ncbi:MAG: hypothetical protein HYW02_08440, partial [Deltaproteobacteria bacterium]|nr:hypothetical protein [Deltaproteobacteria bacterium]
HFSLENLYNSFLGLDPRQKIIALCFIGVLLLLLLFLPFSLVSSQISSLQRKIIIAQKGFRDVQQKIGEYRESEASIASLERKFGHGGSVTGRVEGAAKKLGIAVSQLKENPPQETDFLTITAVDVRFSNATLQQVIDFLQEIEKDESSLMRVRRIQIKPKYANRQLLDVSCEVATFALKKET